MGESAIAVRQVHEMFAECDAWQGTFQFLPVMGQERFEFTNDSFDPLTFYAVGIGEIQPDRHFLTDGGSVPAFIKGIPGFEHTRFARSYILHDSNYWHGHYFVGGLPVQCSRAMADKLMYRGIIAEGGNGLVAWTIWAAVRCGAWVVWRRYRKENGK